VTERLRSLPLPQDATLAAWASALNAGGHWANVYDSSWRLVFATDELRLSLGDTGAVSFTPIGSHDFGAEARLSRELAVRTYGGHLMDREERRAAFLRVGPYVLGSMPGGREALRRVVDPEFADLVDALQSQALPPAWFGGAARDRVAGVDVVGSVTYFRIDDSNGDAVGVASMMIPAAGMSQLAAAAYTLDLAHLERTRAVERADRRPAAILMADLEASSPLARRLSTATYFAFGRRLVRAADRCIVDAGGIVGRHVGDGIVAFFLADTIGSESAAATACIGAARSLRDALGDIAADSELAETELSLRFGLHWGGTLYMGRILTAARSEVTALGDEVNEAARIEACANGGRTLASKSLVERLTQVDAAALGINTNHLTYTPISELSTATDKARRDAPSIVVCEV
jgi:class 3 adenylate cyclase